MYPQLLGPFFLFPMFPIQGGPCRGEKPDRLAAIAVDTRGATMIDPRVQATSSIVAPNVWSIATPRARALVLRP